MKNSIALVMIVVLLSLCLFKLADINNEQMAQRTPEQIAANEQQAQIDAQTRLAIRESREVSILAIKETSWADLNSFNHYVEKVFAHNYHEAPLVFMLVVLAFYFNWRSQINRNG